jgi:hypothetical protein
MVAVEDGDAPLRLRGAESGPNSAVCRELLLAVIEIVTLVARFWAL